VEKCDDRGATQVAKNKNIISHTQGTALQGGKESQAEIYYEKKVLRKNTVKVRWHR
jgi:hypothetical protein